MDFAPYQDAAPERERALSPNRAGAISPPPGGVRRTFSPGPTSPQLAPTNNNNSNWAAGSVQSSSGFGGIGSGREEVNVFETRLGFRMDFEAMAAYILLPPAGAVALLVTEQKSDYVRFHAWQSALLFSVIFVIHLIFSWSPVISWILFVGDVGLIAWLSLRAYRDADMLDRNEVPFFGSLASQILDDE